MCGRNGVFHPASVLADHFDATMAIPDYRPRYNIAPGAAHPVVTNEAPERIVAYRWGLRPAWSESEDRGYINARAETACEKPAFAESWRQRPCLVPSSGFYEWAESERGGASPYRICHSEEEPMAFAGLWRRWTGANGPVETMAILTTAANDVVAPIHDRMPVVLRPSEYEQWLTGDSRDRHALCRPYPGDELCAYRIGTGVNDPTHDDPSVIGPGESHQTGLENFG